MVVLFLMLLVSGILLNVYRQRTRRHRTIDSAAARGHGVSGNDESTVKMQHDDENDDSFLKK
jgi:hypothetical protein